MPSSPVAVKDLSHDPGRLRRRRLAAGLTQTALALAAGCSKAQISQMESGKHGGGPALLVRLAASIGCEVTDLMPRGGPRPMTEAAADEFWAAIAAARARDGAATAPGDTRSGVVS